MNIPATTEFVSTDVLQEISSIEITTYNNMVHVIYEEINQFAKSEGITGIELNELVREIRKYLENGLEQVKTSLEDLKIFRAKKNWREIELKQVRGEEKNLIFCLTR